jgi:hypothetical protein
MNGTQDQTKSESAPNVNQLDGTQKNQRKCNCGNCKICKKRESRKRQQERLKLENPELYKEKNRAKSLRKYYNRKARNPEKVREQKRIHQNKYYHRSAKYRIRTIFGTRFREFLNGKGVNDSTKS